MKVILNKPIVILERGKRDNQEDTIYPLVGHVTENDRLFIICDGMGGHAFGEVASNTVCNVLSQYVIQHFSSEDIFKKEHYIEAINAAYDALDKKDNGANSIKMGTTLAFLFFHRGGCFIAHIGDSRIYHIRPSERSILYQSRDHSVVYELYESGVLTEEEMLVHPQKNIITRVMQPLEKRDMGDIDEITDICAGDYFYICSDGMLERMPNNQILEILCSSDINQLEILKKYTEDNQDNHSAYLIHIQDVLYD